MFLQVWPVWVADAHHIGTFQPLKRPLFPKRPITDRSCSVKIQTVQRDTTPVDQAWSPKNGGTRVYTGHQPPGNNYYLYCCHAGKSSWAERRSVVLLIKHLTPLTGHCDSCGHIACFRSIQAIPSPRTGWCLCYARMCKILACLAPKSLLYWLIFYLACHICWLCVHLPL